ncbi:MAG: GNAT family N-acetyltransferase [Gammaproteobacteria bacterium]|nr:GNAT family N-acetyltransferase [Gammaproteobacteria bacterium]
MGIRLARSDDLPVIVEIYNQAVKAGYYTADTTPLTLEERQSWLAVHSKNKYPVFVFEHDDHLKGFLSISAYRPGRQALRHTAEVSFYVDFDFHRQGIASLLLKHAISVCPSLQIKNLFAIIMETNSASSELLKLFGFQQWGYLPEVADFSGNEVGQIYYGLRIK